MHTVITIMIVILKSIKKKNKIAINLLSNADIVLFLKVDCNETVNDN